MARFCQRRHFCVSWLRDEDLPVIAEQATGFFIDNGAFTAWKQGEPIKDWRPYCEYVHRWANHPRFDFAIIPDEVEGTEADNDALISKWFRAVSPAIEAIPVWHFHESWTRLERLVRTNRRIALGSSGEWPMPGTERWHNRMGEIMERVTVDGVPRTRLHGLRMLNPDIVRRYPFASADSTNVAQNCDLLPRFGMYKPPTRAQRMEVIAARIEATNSPAVWDAGENQLDLFSLRKAE